MNFHSISLIQAT